LAPDIATIGDNCIDRYGPPINLSTVGGNALNVAVQLRRLGMQSAYFGAVGNDQAGHRTLERLNQNAVDTTSVRVLPGATAFTELAIGPDGDRIIGQEDFGVCRGYRLTEHDVVRLKRMRHVHIGWMDDDGEAQRRLAGEGVSLSKDLAVNPGAGALDIAFASAGPSRERAKLLLETALAARARLVVVTMAALGSIASNGHALVEVDAKPTTVRDTLGAGDTFIAGFIAAQMRGAALAACLSAGHAAAAESCTHWGGFPQQPEAL
jgi:fructoselysine 6-kinase